MTVLHVLDHSLPLLSGYSFRSQSIIEFQRRSGINSVVLTSPKQGSLQEEVEEVAGVRHYRTLKIPPRLTGRLPFISEVRLMMRTARRIAEVVKKEKIDIIHAHSPLLNGLPALWIGHRFGIPVAYEARAFWEDAAVDHGTCKEKSIRYRLIRMLETVLFKRVDRVVTICEGMRRDVIQRGVGAEKIMVVPNGVDAKWFQPHPRADALGEQLGLDGNPVFGFIGSFYHYEGLRFLFDAFPKIAKKVPGVKLLMVGGGVEEPILREMARKFAESVIFAGQVSHDKIRDYYSVADVLVFPRLRMRLTELVTPLKPLEAMAMAKAVLASDVGGHRELIRHESTGLLFESGNEENFVGMAVRAANDAKLRVALGESARRYVTEERTWERLVKSYLSLYEQFGARQAQQS
jgi:glycogen(starch) synthase